MDFLTMDFKIWSAVALGVGLVIITLKEFRHSKRIKGLRNAVLKAEAKAFGKLLENDAAKRAEAEPDVALNAVEESQRILQIGSLFDLCNKRIEKYQAETEARARWSFYFSVIAMIAGLSVVLFAAKVLLKTPTWEGASVAAIGGAISTFITKTFLDVHKLSLQQLNHYFRQPVLHSHILTAHPRISQTASGSGRADALHSDAKPV